jgi:hypothetical protein
MTRIVVVGQPELRNEEEMEVDFLLSPLSFLVPLKGHFIAPSPFQAFLSGSWYGFCLLPRPSLYLFPILWPCLNFTSTSSSDWPVREIVLSLSLS